jgi:hypothetical protein
MKKLNLSLFAIVFCIFFTGKVVAQSDKVSINIIPKPNQTSRWTVTQEIVIDITFEGELPEPLAAMKTMRIEMKSALGMTQKNGSLDDKGRLEAEIIFDQVSSEMTMNGIPFPLEEKIKKFIGRKGKVIYDSKGEIIDYKVSDDPGSALEIFEQMMQSIDRNLPEGPTSLGIGETTVIPMNMDLPIPRLSAAPIKIEGQAKIKLVALDNEADGRIAKFDDTAEAKFINTTEMDLSSGKKAMNIDLKMNSSGTSQFNLDKGLLKLSEEKIAIDGKIAASPNTRDAQLPDIVLKVTMKNTVRQN